MTLALASCSSSSPSAKGDLVVKVKDFKLTAASSHVRAGDVRITVQNSGAIAHEFVAFRTDLDETSLPLTKKGDRIDEAGAGITHLDPEAEDVHPRGGSKTITINLPAGRYVFVCNLAAHYGKGMHTVVTAT